MSSGLIVLALDEEEPALEELAYLLSEDPRVKKVIKASDPTSALRRLTGQGSDGQTIDVVFLDYRIASPDGTDRYFGLELARIFSSMISPPSVVFVTAHDDRAIDAYEIGAADYLLKPLRSERLAACIDRIMLTRSAAPLRVARSTARQSKIFLCHSSGDKAQVNELHRKLTDDGFSCWSDEDDLLPGQNWNLEITQAIEESGFVLACLSQASINKKGYLQKELKKALDVADEQPEGTVFLIPVRLEPCRIPQRLQRWQWVDLFTESGYARLLISLRAGGDDQPSAIYPGAN